MARYTGPRDKIIKKLGLSRLPGLRNAAITQKNKFGKKSVNQYKTRMQEKQKLKYHYGVTERQMVQYFLKAKRAKGSTADRLLIELEMRLDNIVFRLGLAPTIRAARQMVTHGHINVNNKKMRAPGYACKPGDEIQINKQLIQTRSTTSSECTAVTERARHLILQENGGRVAGFARKRSLPMRINDLLVVEYYSK